MSTPITLKRAIEAFDEGKVLTHPLFEDGEYFFKHGSFAIISTKAYMERIPVEIFWDNRRYNVKERLSRSAWENGYMLVTLESDEEVVKNQTPEIVFSNDSIQLFAINSREEAIYKISQGFMISHEMLPAGGYILKGGSGRYSVILGDHETVMLEHGLKRFLRQPYFKPRFVSVKILDSKLCKKDLRKMLCDYHESNIRKTLAEPLSDVPKPKVIDNSNEEDYTIKVDIKSVEPNTKIQPNYFDKVSEIDTELFTKAQEIIQMVYLMGYSAFYSSIESEEELKIIHKSIHNDSIKFIDLLIISLKNLAIEDPAMKFEIRFLNDTKKVLEEMNTYTTLMLFSI